MSSAHVRATIGGDTTEYRRALSGMEGMTKSSARNLTRIFASIGIGAIMQRWGRAVIRWGEENSIAARQVGMLTDEMIALNRLGIQSGMRGAQDFSRLVSRLSDELMRAARGSEESARKFTNLNLAVGDLISMNPAQQLEAVSKAAFDSGVPLAHLIDLFGQRLAPTAMIALKDIAENGFPEVDTAIGDTADKIEELGSVWAKSMDQMKAATASFATGWFELSSRQFSVTAGIARHFMGGGTVRDLPSAVSTAYREGIERRTEEREERRTKRVKEQRDVIEQMQRIYAEMGLVAAAPGGAARGPMTPGAGMGTDALRRIGGMTDTGASAVREQTQLDRTRNTMLSRIEASTRMMAQRRDQSANFSMR